MFCLCMEKDGFISSAAPRERESERWRERKGVT